MLLEKKSYQWKYKEKFPYKPLLDYYSYKLFCDVMR
jgi:hypothetical protein